MFVGDRLRAVAGRARDIGSEEAGPRSDTLTDDALIVRFSVSESSLNAKKVLDPGEYPYQFDVVEVFVTFSDNGFPYFEFEVSPYNQTFQVKIVSAKEHQEGVDLGMTSTATIATGGWKAELNIPLKSLGWDGEPEDIGGNFYSVLGPASERSYWSTFLPKAAKANFHQPQYFKPLLQCSQWSGFDIRYPPSRGFVKRMSNPKLH